MASLYLKDILNRNGLNPKRVKLVRHSLKHDRFNICNKAGFFDEYQKIQKVGFFNNCDYILSFISAPGTSAKFVGCYEVGAGVVCSPELMQKDFPCPEMYNKEDMYYDLRLCDILSDLQHRLIIDWGKAAVSWHQWATNEKPVLAIQENVKLTFFGYENVLLMYDELKQIIGDFILYENWHTALSSVYAIYLIVDTTDGKQYVGSAYGAGGLLDRWKCYVDTKHGGNKKMMQLLNAYPERFKGFQFSVLQILPKTITSEEVVRLESLYKAKFQSITFGLNDN